ncbi:MAG: ABC-F family ATP-binding cassette domain-containing protein [Desulfocapsaceae bacterium]|nr:ABC-F family ATP-binding cassette domain-containing protein [Desulfocapsaceae bacterium]
MSNLVACQSLAKSFGAEPLFQDIDLIIHPGDRIGLVGPNGSGKSTLLKIICGLEEADEGALLYGKQVKLGYLAQEDIFDEELTASENLYAALADHTLEDADKHARIAELLSRAEFGDDSQQVRYLSGGWRKRLAICRVLLNRPTLLAFDEPTNHLDIEGIIWLEKLILSSLPDGPSAFILVSHDRQFLENCANRMVELSPMYSGGSFQVQGAYRAFEQKRQVHLEQQMEMEHRLSNKVRRENEWLDRGPKARTSKARYRIDKAHRLQDELADVKRRNRSSGKFDLEFRGTGRKTKKLLEATQLTKSYGDKKLFATLDIVLSPGSRLGLLGKNGCGKSTLMEILAAGEESVEFLDEGSIKTADKINIVHFDQKRAKLDTSLSLRRALAPEGDSVVFQGRSLHVVSWAKRFLFKADQLETPVRELSGGEQARILIASLMLQPADILLLDEPTNDLDIGSLYVLEESLTEFAGALILVSHDRYLLDRVCDRVIGFTGEGDAGYYADYRQWLAALQEKTVSDQVIAPLTNDGKASQKEKGRAGVKAGRLSYLDQREYDQLEGKIEELETLQAILEEELVNPSCSADPEKLEECWQKLEAVKKEVEALYDRWQELEEKKGSS